MKKTVLIGFAAMFALTLSLGAYAAVFGQAEMVHFWIAFPAGNVTEPITLRGAGPPVSMAPIVIDLDQRGVLKNVLNPSIEAFSTHWIYNLGTKPVKVQLELTNTTFPVQWEVSANLPYDEETHTFTELLYPGQSIKNLGIDWYFRIPAYYMDEKIIYQGGLKVIDANTKQVLTFIPIIIGHGQEIVGGVADCCS
jgi:hypothetical protein